MFSENYKYKVGFIGAGKMAQALATGFLSAGILKAKDMLASAPSTRNTSYFKDELGIQTVHCNLELVRTCSVMIIAVKPHFVNQVLDQIESAVHSDQVVVSVAAGVGLALLEKFKNFAIIRAIPNLPVQVRAGVTVFARGKHVSDDAVKGFQELFKSLGICQEVPETMIDAVTGMAGSGTAFVLLMMQAMADGGVKMGIPRHLAHDFAIQTFLGSAKLVQDSKKHPAILMEEVASPGGTTIHGLHQLEKDGVRAALMNAVEAATKQAKALEPK